MALADRYSSPYGRVNPKTFLPTIPLDASPITEDTMLAPDTLRRSAYETTGYTGRAMTFAIVDDLTAPAMREAPPESRPGVIDSDHYAGDIYTHKGIRERAEWVVSMLRELRPDFIAVRGVSGMSIGYAAAALYDIPIVVCRKGEQAHTSQQVHGDVKRAGRYVIVDDFVSSGETVNTIDMMVRRACLGGEPELLAVLCYVPNRDGGVVKVNGRHVPIHQRRRVDRHRPPAATAINRSLCTDSKLSPPSGLC